MHKCDIIATQRDNGIYWKAGAAFNKKNTMLELKNDFK